LTLRFISPVVAVCSSTAEAIVVTAPPVSDWMATWPTR
jgi:hypothetical protein